jgi:predicted RND superfamily exporter protein
VLGAGDLPTLARRPFTERDGTVGRALLVYPAESVSMWNGHDLLATSEILQTLTLDDGAVIRSSGSPMIFGAMLRSVLHDGPRATVLALAAVLLVVFLVVRPFGAALPAALAMLAGVVWMLGAAGLAGVRITFLNFIALPITFGIGVEYAVNVAARLRRHPGPAGATGSTGAAVVLCSWTTIVGYGSLLAARSQALRGFGAMAILGEIACLLAAVLALPAFLAWRRHATASGATSFAAAEERGAAERGRLSHAA